MTFFGPDTFVIICVVIVMLLFLVRAIFARIAYGLTADSQGYEEYLFASKELTIRDIRESTAATYSAFATVFFWFVALGGIYSWLLFLIPVFLYLGNDYFTRFVQKSDLRLGQYSTISSFLRGESKYKPLHYMADWIIVVFLYSAVLVEIVIGSSILASMIPSVPSGQLFFVILLSIIVIAYVIIGGFRTVILSDTVQLYLALAGTIALVIFATLYLPTPDEARGLIYPPKITWASLLAYLVSVVVVQLFGPLCQLQNWQRISSASEQELALRGHRQGALFGAGLWSLMIVGALILYVKLAGSVSFPNIFAEMKAGGIFSAYALYPLLFVGFIGAMISTADSAMAALYLFFYDAINRRKETQGLTFNPTMRQHILIGAGLFGSILGVYWINQTDIQSLTISVIYFLFNQLLVVFPVLFFFIRENQLRRQEQKRSLIEEDHDKVEKNIALALSLGWLTVFVMTAIGYFTKMLIWMMFASGSGVAVTYMFMIPSWNKLRAIRAHDK